MYSRKFNQESLSKHHVMFSTICLSLGLSILTTLPFSCSASDPHEENGQRDERKHTALVRWQPVVVDPELLVSIEMGNAQTAFIELDKFLKAFNDEQFKKTITKRELERHRLEGQEVTEERALTLYQNDKAKLAWNYKLSLKEVLTALKNYHLKSHPVIELLSKQNQEMRAYIEATEKAQGSQQSVVMLLPDLERPKQVSHVSEDKDAITRRNKELEEEIEAKKKAEAAANAKAEEEKQAAEQVRSENARLQRQLEAKEAELAQLRQLSAQAQANQAQVLQPPVQNVQPAHGLTDQQVVQLQAEAAFYKERVSWFSQLLDWMFNRTPNPEAVPLRINGDV
jgi:DNA segregation ATPase FtsK/SpoIIIE-like protein